jgi:hypothetical protein
MCPQCIADADKKQFEKIIAPLGESLTFYLRAEKPSPNRQKHGDFFRDLRLKTRASK